MQHAHLVRVVQPGKRLVALFDGARVVVLRDPQDGVVVLALRQLQRALGLAKELRAAGGARKKQVLQ